MKNKTIPAKKISTILLGICTLFATVALLVSFSIIARLNRLDTASMKENIRTSGQIAKLQFCLDHGITPCDEISLTEWNSTHSDDEQFNLSVFRY